MLYNTLYTLGFMLCNKTMTARSKLRGQLEDNEAASSFCPFAPVESFLVAKFSIGERRCCGSAGTSIGRGSHVTTVTACPNQGCR